MSEKLHIEAMLKDEEAHFILDEMEFIESKIRKVKSDLWKLKKQGNKNTSFLENVELIYLGNLGQLHDMLFTKYYIDKEIDSEADISIELSAGAGTFLPNKISFVQFLLDHSFGREYDYYEYSETANTKAKKLGFDYLDKSQDATKGKKYIEFILDNKSDVKLLKKMEVALQKAREDMEHYIASGERLYKKNHLNEYVDLVYKIKEIYYFDCDVDYYATIKSAFCKFETFDKFKEVILKTQNQRKTRKTQPKIIVEKATALGLM